MNSIKYDYWINRSDNWIVGRDKHMLAAPPIVEYVQSITSPDSIILDIGTGTGRYLNHFAYCRKLYGVDFISKFIDVAQNIKPDNCELFVDDVVYLKFNKKVDVVFTMTVLQHIHPHQIDKALINITNLLPSDIILWEFSDKTVKSDASNDAVYQYGHDYSTLLSKHKYYLYYEKLHSNNITFIMHFKRS